MPNIMTYAFQQNDTSSPYTQASNYGINTSVFWVNMGQDMTIFMILVAFWPFVYLFSKMKIGRVAMKFGNILHYYRYSMFLRFWIQIYLDAGFYSLIQLKAVSVT